MESSKKDWKMYREKISEWQENYMERLVQEYIKYLQKDVPASTKFWEMEKQIKIDKKKPGVLLEMSKSNMIWDIARLLHDGIITIDDLEGFTGELIESVEYILKR